MGLPLKHQELSFSQGSRKQPSVGGEEFLRKEGAFAVRLQEAEVQLLGKIPERGSLGRRSVPTAGVSHVFGDPKNGSEVFFVG